MLKLNKYLKIKIFSYLTLKELLSFRLVNKVISKVILEHGWSHIIVKSKFNINDVVKIFNFSNYDFEGTKITDESVKLLVNCHTLNLCNTNITDESVRLLVNCHTLDLSHTKITDESVKLLGNCHTLNLSRIQI
jgi:hypothetical protein